MHAARLDWSFAAVLLATACVQRSHPAQAADTSPPDPGFVTLEGALDPEQIRPALLRAAPALLYCYELGLATNPALEGGVVVRFAVAGDGRVNGATLESTTSLPDAKVAACARDAYRELEFPRSTGGSTTLVVPIHFLKHPVQAKPSVIIATLVRQP